MNVKGNLGIEFRRLSEDSSRFVEARIRIA
jgi:hypothetical protein